MPWAFAGFTADEVETGLRVAAVFPDGFADRVGLAPGDLLVTFAGAPVFTQWCLQALLRILPQGELIEATWVRDRQVTTASATL